MKKMETWILHFELKDKDSSVPKHKVYRGLGLNLHTF